MLPDGRAGPPCRAVRRRFSADARDYAERVNARLVLIDGPELAALMIEHDCGVIVEESFVLKQVDENFFEEA